MFEFFLALFGGAYLSGKIAKEHIEDKAISTHRSISDSILKRMHVHDELTFNINKVFKSGKSEEMWDLISAIPDNDLAFIFGAGWKDLLEQFFNNYYVYEYDPCRDDLSYIPNILEAVLLSQNGREKPFQKYKIIGTIAGIPSEYISIWDMAPDYNYMTKIYPGIRERACQIIERNMRKYYSGIELVIDPFEPGKTMKWNFLFVTNVPRNKPW